MPTNDEKGVQGRDPESHRPAQISHFTRILHQDALTPEVINARYHGAGTEEDPYIINWIDQDPVDPMNYSNTKKWSITMLVAVSTLAVAFVSSAFSGGLAEILIEFKATTIVGTLGLSLFVLGFAIGPLIWAPMSELFGRQYLFFFTYLMLTAFNAGAAGAPNIGAIIVLRFFAGAFGSSPLTNAGGVIADLFPASQRGLAMSIFASAPFLGPVVGPIVGGFVGESIGWRWVQGVMAIFTGVLWILCSLLVPETYAPVLLRRRAAKLSKMTGKVYVSRGDAQSGRVSIGQAFKTSMLRPWILLFREPIVMLLSIYMAIIYGTLYMLFGAFPIVYQQGRGWSQGIGGLAFLGVAVGMMFAVVYSIWDNKRYRKAIDASPSGFAPPEARLPPAIIGSVAMPIGMFWFAWTNSPSIHWIVSIMGTAPFGFGMVLVFLSNMNYLIDAYVIFAASVLAASAVLRSLFGAAFPLFTPYMYDALGIHWASSIPAFLALACTPFPFLFYKYGPAIRKRCKFAAEAEEFLLRLREDADQETTSDATLAPSEHTKEDHDNDNDDNKSAAEKETQRRRMQEAHLEAEAIDHSYGAEEDQPEYMAIRSSAAVRDAATHGELRRQHSVTYDGNPYDIDRVNTNESFGGAHSRSRASSLARKG